MMYADKVLHPGFEAMRQRGPAAGCVEALRRSLAFLLLLLSPIMPAQAKTLSIVAFGDSLTAGYMLTAGDAFPAVLEAALRKDGFDVTVVNAGLSGDTTSGGLDRLDWSVPDGTDGVILELGANDMLRGADPAVPAKALDTIITRLKARNIPVLLAGMRASANLGPDYVKRFDAIYPDLAQRYGLVLYPFFLAGVVGQAGFTLDDGLHPSAKGVERIVEGILPVAEQFLDRLKAGTN